MNERTIPELLRCYADVLEELKRRKVVRTNNLTGDYTEWLVAKKMKLQLATGSTEGYDARDKKYKYQIKGRRSEKSRQLSVIRSFEFDYLIAVMFNQDFTVREVWKLPVDVVKKYAKFHKRLNGYVLQLRGEVLEEKKVKELKWR
jgi:hypothetical protein